MNKTLLILIGSTCALVSAAGIINSRPQTHSVEHKPSGYKNTIAPSTRHNGPVQFQTVLGPGTADWEPDGAGKPFILKEDRTYKMWYTANNYHPVGNYWVNGSAIAYAESQDGVNWTNQQIVHARDNAKEEHLQACEPWIIKDDGIYRMWHTDYYKWLGGDWSTYISLILSTDGINWANEKEVLSGSGNFSDYDDYATRQPSVILDQSGTYAMWYTVSQRPKVGSLGPSNIVRASSANGTDWTKKQLALARIPDSSQESIVTPDVIRNNDKTYTMYYANGSGSIYQATSPDGINWTDRKLLLMRNQLDSNILGLGGPYYFKDTDETEYLYFSFTRPATGKLSFKEYIGRARLADIISCTPLPDADAPTAPVKGLQHRITKEQAISIAKKHLRNESFAKEIDENRITIHYGAYGSKETERTCWVIDFARRGTGEIEPGLWERGYQVAVHPDTGVIIEATGYKR